MFTVTMKTLPPKAFPSHAQEPPFLKVPGKQVFTGKRCTTQDMYYSATQLVPAEVVSTSLQGFIKTSMIKSVILLIDCLKIAFHCFLKKPRQPSKSKITMLSLSFECLLFVSVLRGPSQRTEIKPITFSHSLLNG